MELEGGNSQRFWFSKCVWVSFVTGGCEKSVATDQFQLFSGITQTSTKDNGNKIMKWRMLHNGRREGGVLMLTFSCICSRFDFRQGSCVGDWVWNLRLLEFRKDGGIWDHLLHQIESHSMLLLERRCILSPSLSCPWPLNASCPRALDCIVLVLTSSFEDWLQSGCFLSSRWGTAGLPHSKSVVISPNSICLWSNEVFGRFGECTPNVFLRLDHALFVELGNWLVPIPQSEEETRKSLSIRPVIATRVHRKWWRREWENSA